MLTCSRYADLKRELIARQVQYEIYELNSPTALQRFGAPFSSEFGEVAPVDSELPILRYIFVHHVRNFPFLDQAHEKEFWQDKLQVVSFPVSALPQCEESLGIDAGGLVPGILCQKACFILGRPLGGDEAKEVGTEVREACGADDGFGGAHGVWL